MPLSPIVDLGALDSYRAGVQWCCTDTAGLIPVAADGDHVVTWWNENNTHLMHAAVAGVADPTAYGIYRIDGNGMPCVEIRTAGFFAGITGFAPGQGALASGDQTLGFTYAPRLAASTGPEYVFGILNNAGPATIISMAWSVGVFYVNGMVSDAYLNPNDGLPHYQLFRKPSGGNWVARRDGVDITTGTVSVDLSEELCVGVGGFDNRGCGGFMYGWFTAPANPTGATQTAAEAFLDSLRTPAGPSFNAAWAKNSNGLILPAGAF